MGDLRTATGQPHADRDPVEALAAEFVEQLRRGESATAEEYAQRHPELAEQIRELFPTIAAMERLKTPGAAGVSGRSPGQTARPERLGDFYIVREIGRGGMGIVYEAKQQSLGRQVAVKVLPRLATLDSKHLQRFQREARTAANLHHTNIVPVFGLGQHDDLHYYVMQYIEGVGLDRILARLKSTGAVAGRVDLARVVSELAPTDSPPGVAPTEVLGPTSDWSSQGPERPAGPTAPLGQHATTAEPTPDAPPEQQHPATTARAGASRRDATDSTSYWHAVALVARQVADALHYAHGKGVLHRDIKPANLIVDTQGVVWVADFGLAKAMQQDDVSRTGEVLGTPAYMAPEQLRGQTDHRSDVYGLGLTLYELLILKGAFQDTDPSRLLGRIAREEPPRPRQIRPDVPRDLETIVLKATAHEPSRRYQSAGKLAADLQRFLEGRPVHARRISSVERFWRWCRRNPVVAGLSATAAVLLLLVAVVASIGYVRTTKALAGEQAQRRRAEKATELALEVLDRLYERFAPDKPGVASPGLGSRAADGQAAKPVLSEGTAAVLEDLLAFYDRLAEQSDSDDEYLEKVALANRRVGDIRHHLGQLEQAAAAYRRALELYAEIDEGSQQPHRLELASINAELGIVLERWGKLDEAEESWQTALALFAKAGEAGADQAEVNREVARVRDFLERPGDRRLPERRIRPRAGAPLRGPANLPPGRSGGGGARLDEGAAPHRARPGSRDPSAEPPGAGPYRPETRPPVPGDSAPQRRSGWPGVPHAPHRRGPGLDDAAPDPRGEPHPPPIW
jgi:serine/threonine protein kinase